MIKKGPIKMSQQVRDGITGKEKVNRPDLIQELFGPVAESEAEIKAVNFLPQIQTRKKI
jgi:hypothetical protein